MTEETKTPEELIERARAWPKQALSLGPSSEALILELASALATSQARQRELEGALRVAHAAIDAAPHGDNCFLHSDGGEFDRCFCGKDSISEYVAAALLNSPAGEQPDKARSGVYVASRASLPARGEMWRSLRAQGVPIISTWIDEDGPEASHDLADLWDRIRREVTSAELMVLYVEPDDFPLKGALIEAGMALSAQVPIRIVAPGVTLEPRSCRPLGSWVKSPLVSFHATVEAALEQPEGCAAPSPTGGER